MSDAQREADLHHPSPIAHRPLHLALVRQRYTPFGGAERLVSNAIQALSAEGASLTVVTRRWEAGDGRITGPAALALRYMLKESS